MTSDQRRCMQRSRFVCRILNFCVKTSYAATEAPCLRGGKCGLRSNRFYNGKNEIKRVYMIVDSFIRLTAAILSVQFRLREVTRWTKTEFVHSSLATQPE